MSNPATGKRDIIANRWAPLVHVFAFQGIDLTGATFDGAIRQVPDASGSPLVVLATQTLAQVKPQPIRIVIDGALQRHVVAKDVILAILSKFGVAAVSRPDLRRVTGPRALRRIPQAPGLSLVRPCCSSSVIELESRGGRRGLGSQSSILSPSFYRQVFSFGSLLSPTSGSQRPSGIHSSG